jgi:ABC-2 type transport system ATP-binding protein
VSTTDCAVQARQLVKTYAVRGSKPRNRQGIRALDGLDISVPRGMICGLLGPNGAGKSTTVKILTSLARPDSGQAHVEGVDVLARPGQVRHMHRPAVLFLDEPTTGLDPESRAARWQEIARLAGGEGMTVRHDAALP